ncbi:rRNA adenine N-6-methyltransferase family protein [Nocardiopsis aegyptia]|uniref:rRNA adenine N-6-methyltransferase family protein n=1 Tax=Nocardiopsis aegyptia TaxID=220378 RepID=UPI00366FA20A
MNLAEQHAKLVAELKTSEAVRAAFADHPRHRYIPDMVWPDATGLPLYRTADPDRWASIVYTHDAVTTQANDGGSGAVNTPSSSSSAPQVMVDMIEAAGIEPGMRVLEIGAGTGWNAAILSSLVGPTGTVTSLEIDPGVAAHARSRLSGTDVRVITGAEVPGTGAFDALIATCAVRRVPVEWIERVGLGAHVVVPWAPYAHGGPTPIAALRKTAESIVVGPFARDGAFMRDRTQRAPVERFPGNGAEPTRTGIASYGSAELLDRDLLTRLVLTCPGLYITVGGRPFKGRSAPVIALSSGRSWAWIWPDGSATGGGTAPLLEEFTTACERLDDAGWPDLGAFSLEVDTRGGTYVVRADPLGPWEHPV